MPPFQPSTARVEPFSAEDELRSSSENLRFPAAPTPHSILFIFKTYNYEQGFTNGGFSNLLAGIANPGTGRSTGVTLRGSNSIELPFPRQLVDSTNLRMNNFERDVLTEQIAGRINNYIKSSGNSTIGDIPGAIRNMGADLNTMLENGGNRTLSDFVQGLLGVDAQDAATAAQYLLRSRLSGEIQRSINNTTGQAINPRETLAFEGVQLRTHSFNWDLYPSNQADSDRIRRIVRAFKGYVLPSAQSVGSIAKAFLSYPSVVETRLIGVNNEDYMKFKPAMVTNFTVDYGAGGNMSFLRGGRPAGVNISLQLTELEIETANDYFFNGIGEQVGVDREEVTPTATPTVTPTTVEI